MAGFAAQRYDDAIAARGRVRRKTEVFGVFQVLHGFAFQTFHLYFLHAAGCFDAGDFAAEGLADAVKCPLDTVVYGFCIHLNHLHFLPGLFGLAAFFRFGGRLAVGFSAFRRPLGFA